MEEEKIISSEGETTQSSMGFRRFEPLSYEQIQYFQTVSTEERVYVHSMRYFVDFYGLPTTTTYKYADALEEFLLQYGYMGNPKKYNGKKMYCAKTYEILAFTREQLQRGYTLPELKESLMTPMNAPGSTDVVLAANDMMMAISRLRQEDSERESRTTAKMEEAAQGIIEQTSDMLSALQNHFEIRESTAELKYQEGVLTQQVEGLKQVLEERESQLAEKKAEIERLNGVIARMEEEMKQLREALDTEREKKKPFIRIGG